MRQQDNLPLYRPNGQPAFGWVQLPAMPSKGDVLTINGTDTYTFGIDFFGTSQSMCLRSLIAAIRADQSEDMETAPGNTKFFRAYSARFEGNYGVIFATAPGSAGNGITLATSNALRIVISGPNFTGGTDAPAATAAAPAPSGQVTGAATSTIAAVNTAQDVLVANASRKYMFFQNQSANNMYIRYDGNAATQDGNSTLIGPGGSQTFDNFIPTSKLSVIGVSIGDKYHAEQA